MVLTSPHICLTKKFEGDAQIPQVYSDLRKGSAFRRLNPRSPIISMNSCLRLPDPPCRNLIDVRTTNTITFFESLAREKLGCSDKKIEFGMLSKVKGSASTADTYSAIKKFKNDSCGTSTESDDSSYSPLFLIEKVMKEPPQQLKFRCSLCKRTFKKSAQLGGHTSRAHPNSSTKYKHVIETKKRREIN